MISYKEKLKNITTFLFDIDGVFTDGNVMVFENDYIRKFNSKDAFAVQLAVKKGFHVFIISGGSSESVRHIMNNLGCKEVVLKASNKWNSFLSLKEKHGVDENNCLYVGDDLPDIPLLKRVHVSACPLDAAIDVKQMCDYQSLYNGGAGVVRDVIEQVLRVQDKWNNDEEHEW